MDAELNGAAEAGNAGKLQELLALTLPEESGKWLKTSLLRATYEGRAKAVWTLLTCKADPTWSDERQETPLHWAARKSHADIVAHLLSFKADVNQQTQQGATAMHLAIPDQRSLGCGEAAEKAAEISGSIVASLIAAKADQTLVTREKETPLHIAAKEGSDIAAEKLLETDPIYDEIANPSIEMSNDRGQTPLVRAAAMGHIAVLQRMIAKGAKMKIKNWWGQGPLHLASQGGHVLCVQELLRHDIDIDEHAQDGTMPLHMACERGHVKVVELLLAREADLQKRASGGRNAVHCAAQRGHSEVLSVLLNYNARLEDRTDEGRTPLCCAALRGHTGSCRLLLERHADPQALDTLRQTALHAAASNGHVDTIEVLLSYRTRLDALDASGRSAIMLAHTNQQEAGVRALLKRGAVLPDSLGNASELAALVNEVERDRLKENIAKAQKGQNTASLMKAAEREFEESRQRLLELVAIEASAKTAPVVEHLEIELARVTAECRETAESDANIHIQVVKYRDLLAAAEKKKAHCEQEMQYCLKRAALAKTTMEDKKRGLPQMKRDLIALRTALVASQKKSASLDHPLEEAERKIETIKEEFSKHENETVNLSEELAEIQAALQEWHAMRAEAANLHAQSAELLNKTKTTAESTPRD